MGVEKAEMFRVQPGVIMVEFEPPKETVGESNLIVAPESAKGYKNEATVLKIGGAVIKNGAREIEEPPIGLKVGDVIPLNENWLRDRRIEVGKRENGAPDYVWFCAFRDVYAIRTSETANERRRAVSRP